MGIEFLRIIYFPMKTFLELVIFLIAEYGSSLERGKLGYMMRDIDIIWSIL